MLQVPVLIYHAVGAHPPALIAPYAVGAAAFARHLDLVAERGLQALTASAYLDALDRRDDALLRRAVLITFDDGFAGVLEHAAPALRERGQAATLFVTTGLLRGGPQPPSHPALAPAMLGYEDLPRLREAGFELGAHSHTHPHLDTLGRRALQPEIERPRTLLADALGERVATYAYPHGYSGARVRRAVRAAGYRAAFGVKNALTDPGDDRFAIARLMVEADTPDARIAAWLDRREAPAAPRRDALRTRGWRAYRRARALAARRPGYDPGWAAAGVQTSPPLGRHAGAADGS